LTTFEGCVVPDKLFTEHAFSLNFKLAAQDADHGKLMERLSDAGCTDSLIALGVAGHVRLEFLREAGSAEEAVFSAIEDVKKALPTAELVDDDYRLPARRLSAAGTRMEVSEEPTRDSLVQARQMAGDSGARFPTLRETD
jgi:hypothetical protein